MIKRGAAAVLLLMSTGCGDGGLFAEDFKSSYIEVTTDCVQSPTHGNDYVRIWVSSQEVADLIADYASGANTEPDYPVESTLVKEQYAGDPTCSTATGWTISKKVTAGRMDDGSHWAFERREADLSVTEWSGCLDCHRAYAAGDFVAYRP